MLLLLFSHCVPRTCHDFKRGGSSSDGICLGPAASHFVLVTVLSPKSKTRIFLLSCVLVKWHKSDLHANVIYKCDGDHETALNLWFKNRGFLRELGTVLMMSDKLISTEAYVGHKWLSVNQVCEVLGVARSTFYKWRALALAPRVVRLPNGDLRVREDWLDEFLEALPSEFSR